jgi:hypothetical protein
MICYRSTLLLGVTLSGDCRLENVMMSGDSIEGYICPTSDLGTTLPSSVLSEYCGRPVHLVYKGPRLRHAEATPSFPDLAATFRFQDGYPLLILSEESVEAVETKVRDLVGVQGVADRWRTEKLNIERWDTSGACQIDLSSQNSV